jgi:hypothetical protein
VKAWGESSKIAFWQSLLDRIVIHSGSFSPRRKDAEQMSFSGVIADAGGGGDCADFREGYS